MSSLRSGLVPVLALGAAFLATGAAQAADYTFGTQNAVKEDWYVTIGGRASASPSYPGADDYSFRPSLIFSIARASERNVFHSVDDTPSIALINRNGFRAGVAGTIDWGRSESNGDRLRGLGTIDYSLLAGGFAEWFPVEWLRLRAELLYGMGGFSGVRGDLRADFIYNQGRWHFAAGPRLSYAGSDYMQTYYGVTASQAALATFLFNPMRPYQASSGFDEVGATAQLSYNFDNGITAGVYGAYSYLIGDAADSPLVDDKNQFTTGVTLSYTFNMGPGLW
ncbi:MAG: MipA/OmpV family protein [Xanthobacter sp.]